MTPREIELMNASIRDAVTAAIAPVYVRLDALERTDRKHSGVHKDLGAKVRESQSEINVKVDDRTAALAHRDDQIVGALNELRAEVREGNGAVTAGVGVTRAVQIAANSADANAIATRTTSRRSAWVSGLTIVGLAIWQVVQHILAGSGK